MKIRIGFYVVLIAVLSCAGIALISPATSNATDLPVTTVSGTLGSDATWSAGNVYLVDGGLTIPSSVTLTIEAGAIVKYSQGGGNHGITVAVGATLSVTGTSGQPVIFTSAEDDSLGGDSTSDGATTGTIGDYYSAISQAGGATDIAHAVFKYNNVAVVGAGNYSSGDGSLTVADSVISNVKNGISFSGGTGYGGTISLQRNDFDLSASPDGSPLSLDYIPDLSQVVMSGTNKNTFTHGSPVSTKQLYMSGKVPSGSTWTVSDSGEILVVPNVLSVVGTLNLDTPVTLVEYQINDTGTINVAAGSILKVMETTAIRVGTGGTLNMNGTSTDPVHVTSWADDSIGGDSTGSGPAGGSVGDYVSAVSQAGGTTNIAHTIFSYARAAIVSGSGSSDGSLTVTDSSFSNVSNGIGFNGGSGYTGSVSLQRNSFDLTNSTASDGWPLNIAFVSDLSQIVMSGTNKNTFVAGSAVSTGQPQLGGKVPSGSTWTVSSTTGGAPALMYDTKVAGTLNIDVPVLLVGSTIEATGTVNIATGTVVKVNGVTGFKVNTGGVLNVDGALVNPVRFTSIQDDSLGGDSLGNGTTSGTIGDYTVAIHNNGGSVEADYINIQYATLAYLQSAGQANLGYANIDHSTHAAQVDNGSLVLRGSVHDVTTGVYACDWFLACNVDTAYVDWGSVDGPYPSSGSLVCGQVAASPWTYNSTVYDSTNIFGNACGGTAPSDALSAKISAYQTKRASLEFSCTGGNNDACMYIATYNACTQAAWDIGTSNASFVLPSGSPISNPVGYLAAYLGAASDYVESVEDVSVTGMVFSGGAEFLSVISDINTVSNGYASCLTAAQTAGW